MLFVVLVSITFALANGGSSCPDRSDIHPCVCLNKQIGKTKVETTVVCQGLSDGTTLRAIEANLSLIEIDTLLLYDSYWNIPQAILQLNNGVARNHMSTFRVKELIQLDSELWAFTCPHTEYCRTDYLKRFTAINSTVKEIPACNASIYDWISCPQSIEYLRIQKGYGFNHSLRADFFPSPLTKLRALHMPYNNIARVERRVLNPTTFPNLETLDFSHNYLRDIRSTFISLLPKLKYLDLSFNNIRSVMDFRFLPELRVLNISHNHIVSLLQNHWVNTPEKLMIIDLTNNNIDCNCGNTWVNGTFHISTNIMGKCATPSEVANIKIRRASRLLIERCDDQGRILASRIRTTTPSGQQ